MNTTSYNSMAPYRVIAVLRRLACVAVLGLALSLFANKIIDTDIWWHLRTGNYILENHAIPRADMYSYTAGANKWIDLHWLFQVILYATYNVFGSYGMSLLFICVFMAVFLLLWYASRPARNFFPAVILFSVALMATNTRFLARPEAFTYLMIGAYMAIICRYERKGARWLLYLLIPLQILWTNLQGLFVIGPFLIFVYLVEYGIRENWGHDAASCPQFSLQTGAPEKYAKGFRPFLAVFIGSLAACLVNPYGFDGMTFPFTLFSRVGGMQNVFAASIAEFQPPFSGYNLTSSIKWFGVFMAVAGLVLAADYKNFRISHALIFLGLGYLAVNARRNIPLFVLALLPLSVEHAGNLLTQLRKAKAGKFARGVGWFEAGVCIVLIAVLPIQVHRIVNGRYYISDRRGERFGFGFKEQTFPRGAFAFIKQNEIRGPFFNNMDIGGMFIYEMYPKEKVFIDARLEVNSADHLSEYRLAMADPLAFDRLCRKYGFNAAVIMHTSQDALYLMPVLYFSSRWALVYLDPIAAVFVRAASENDGVIQRSRIDIARNDIPTLAPNDTLNENSPPFLKKLLAGVNTSSTADIEAHNRFNLGLVFLVMGQNGRAVEYLESGLKLMPFSAEGHYNLGLAYDRLGRKETALQHYKKTIEINVRHARAHANAGRIYDETGLKNEAEKEYELSLKYGGENPIVLYNLGALSYERGEYEAAREWWQRALKQDTSFTPAAEALKKLD